MTAASSPGHDGAVPTPRPFGHYLLHKELGRGAQGIVHLAEDTLLGRRVALKMLTGAQNQEVRDRFQREAKITSKLNHPGICGIYEVGEVEGVPYLAMQYVPGRTLADMLKEARAQELDERRAVQTITITGRSSKGELQDVIRLIERVARALHVAHESGLIHRDIKPHNVMVTPEGDPVLLDFGLARDLDTEGQTLTASGQIMGTPAYLAPEQIVADREHIDRRTDLYALGVTLFECVTLTRPFDAPSWDQLYHKILEGNAPNPCKINPRIPKDLRTVIETAMERDPKRRYPNCSDFADDLQRVRSYEPIAAKAANLLVRTGKWARRRPGRAAAVTVGLVFVIAGAGSFAYRVWHRQAMVAEHLGVAQARLANGDHTGALDAVSAARTFDPDSARAVELRVAIEASQLAAAAAAARAQAFAAAAEARAESARHLARYQTANSAASQLARELEQHSGPQLTRQGETASGARARRERDLEGLRIEAQLRAEDAKQALQRAARLEAPFGDVSAQTQADLATTYLALLRDAWAAGDTLLAEVLAPSVVLHDRAGAHREELLGHGTLTVTVTPPDAEVYLFRYEDYASVRDDDPVPRLVPVPTAGIGRVRERSWHGAFHPGDPCLCITAVPPNSSAAAAGLCAGDLVVGIDDGPATGAFVRAVREPFATQGVVPGQRLLAVDGIALAHPFDLALVPPRADAAPSQFRFAGRAAEVAGPRACIEIGSARALLAGAVMAAVELHCLRDGEPLRVAVPAGAVAGLDVTATACPLICSSANRIAAGRCLEVAAGGYLLFVRASGHEALRQPVVVARRADVATALALLPAGTSPPGFVHVPAGPFVRGGDALAVGPRPRELVDLPEFWIERLEHTNAAWFEFLNEPAMREQLAATQPPHPFVPRDNNKELAKPDDSGFWRWTAHTATSADSPVLGVSWQDVDAYIAWRNERATAGQEAFVYALPLPDQWEKAARGLDGRSFPWGNRFDPCLTVCTNHRPTYLLDAPGAYALRDESVYGVFDLAGSREEWTSASEPLRSPGQAPSYYKLGGSWSVAVDTVFRAASRPVAAGNRAAAQQGFRLVARRR